MEKRKKGTGGEGREGKQAGSKFSRFFHYIYELHFVPLCTRILLNPEGNVFKQCRCKISGLSLNIYLNII